MQGEGSPGHLCQGQRQSPHRDRVPTGTRNVPSLQWAECLPLSGLAGPVRTGGRRPPGSSQAEASYPGCQATTPCMLAGPCGTCSRTPSENQTGTGPTSSQVPHPQAQEASTARSGPCCTPMPTTLGVPPLQEAFWTPAGPCSLPMCPEGRAHAGLVAKTAAGQGGDGGSLQGLSPHPPRLRGAARGPRDRLASA